MTAILAGHPLGMAQLPFLVAALSSGALVGIVTLGLLPVLELLFEESTDPKLLELASPDHPVLRGVDAAAGEVGIRGGLERLLERIVGGDSS